MARYLVEADHDGIKHDECSRLMKASLGAGAQWARNVEWNCDEHTHKCWIIIEADSEADARRLVPPTLGNVALLVKLNKFTPEEINAMHDTDEAE